MTASLRPETLTTGAEQAQLIDGVWRGGWLDLDADLYFTRSLKIQLSFLTQFPLKPFSTIDQM